jgi:hypothetical protein
MTDSITTPKKENDDPVVPDPDDPENPNPEGHIGTGGTAQGHIGTGSIPQASADDPARNN